MKEIYGLAMPFGSSGLYSKFDTMENVWKIDNTNKESIKFESVVGCTNGHDYGQSLAKTNDGNLTIVVHERGIFFKLVAENPLALNMYEAVKKQDIRCSISYLVKDKERNYLDEINLMQLGLEGVRVYDYKQIVIHEVCLSGTPANLHTFATTDKDDPRLNGVSFDKNFVEMDEYRYVRNKEEQSKLSKLAKEMSAIKQELDILQNKITTAKG